VGKEWEYSTIQYNTVRKVQYSTVQYSTVQYSTVQYNTSHTCIESFDTVFLDELDEAVDGSCVQPSISRLVHQSCAHLRKGRKCGGSKGRLRGQ
jgi:hypothetical protein